MCHNDPKPIMIPNKTSDIQVPIFNLHRFSVRAIFCKLNHDISTINISPYQHNRERIRNFSGKIINLYRTTTDINNFLLLTIKV